MDTRFREAVYGWAVDDDKELESVCYHLQLVFAHLQTSSRKFFNPTAFVSLLGLQPGVQQDAQEFYKLLISLLEARYARSAVPALRTIIQRHFCGTHAYVTVCAGCGTVSERPGTYQELELNLQDAPTLDQCLTKYFMEERMEGDNRYHCDKCAGLQDATRCIALRTLPEVLHLQMMRFVYNTKMDSRQKVHYVINFPHVLDMAPFLSGPAPPATEYVLTSVLVHTGASAMGGHYIAHCRDDDGHWWRFNDDVVTPLKGGEVGWEPDVKLGKKGDDLMRQTTAGKTIASPNAYMLAYTRRDCLAAARVPPALPDRARTEAEDDNRAFLRTLDEYNRAGEEARGRAQERKTAYKDLFAIIRPSSDKAARVVPVDWVARWVRGDDPGALDTTALQCEHGLVDPLRVTAFKRISKAAWDMLHAVHGGGPELGPEDVCAYCVAKFCIDKVGTKDFVDTKRPYVARLERQALGGYWIAKKWLAAWRDASRVDVLTTDLLEGIVCEHGALVASQTKARRIIDEECWLYFSSLVDYEGPVLESSSKQCDVCQQQLAEDKEHYRINRELRDNERKALGGLHSLVKNAKSPAFPPQRAKGQDAEPGRYAMVSVPWLRKWAEYIDDPNAEAKPVDNSALLCPAHGMPMYSPLEPGAHDADEYLTVKEEQYRALVERHGGGPDVLVLEGGAEGAGEGVVYGMEPELCRECHQGRIDAERHEAATYEDVVMEVRVSRWVSFTGKKARGRNSNQFAALAVNREKVTNTTKITVNSTTTVELVKLLVCQATQLEPLRQRVLYAGAELSDSTLTLEQCGVPRTGTLDVEEVTGEDVPSFEAEVARLSVRDAAKSGDREGFHGTALYGFDPAPSSSEARADWSCAECTFVNGSEAPVCGVCRTLRK